MDTLRETGGVEPGRLPHVAQPAAYLTGSEDPHSQLRSTCLPYFLGVARKFSRGREVVHLEYEAYPEMAEKKMAEIGDEIRVKFGAERVAILHRTGVLDIGEVRKSMFSQERNSSRASAFLRAASASIARRLSSDSNNGQVASIRSSTTRSRTNCRIFS